MKWAHKPETRVSHALVCLLAAAVLGAYGASVFHIVYGNDWSTWQLK
jgi:hypothetical protein